MASIERIKVMVLGDSGVGKTSFVHLAAHNEPIKSPSWTVGCTVEVKLHEFREGTKDQKTYFVEFWDVGGSKNHENSRPVFYHPCHGAILVHDLTNRNSEKNLQKWLKELLLNGSFTECSSGSSPIKEQKDNEMDAETMLGANNSMPILVVGTKLDQVDDKRPTISNTSFRYKYNAEEILLDCRQSRYLGAGTSNAVKLCRFFDKVIENKQKKTHLFSGGAAPKTNVFSSKFYLSHQD